LGDPVFNSLEVWLNFFTVAKISWELIDNFNENLNSGNDILDISFGEISDSFINFFINVLGISQACLDQRKIIFLDKSVDHSGDQLFGLVNIDCVLLETECNSSS